MMVEVQNRAFFSDQEKYGYCPGYGHTVEYMEKAIREALMYKILAAGTIVGNLIIRKLAEGKYELGGICVMPEFQGKGIGSVAVDFLKEEFPDGIHWVLETPMDKAPNIAFYKKHGFVITDSMEDGGVTVALFERRG